MDYNAGTILKQKNIRFKETDMRDWRMNGHPVLLPNEVVDFDDYYFLTISSKTHNYVGNESRYFFLREPMPKYGLPLPCIIDLKYIYRFSNKNQMPKGAIPHNLLIKIMAKFNHCEETIKDRDYLDWQRFVNGSMS